MLIRIRETQQLRDIGLVENGIDYTQDMLGNSDALHFNEETEEYEMNEDECEWWEEFFKNYEADEQEVVELANELDINKSELWERIYKWFDGDLDSRHGVIQRELEEIREEAQLKSLHHEEE